MQKGNYLSAVFFDEENQIHMRSFETGGALSSISLTTELVPLLRNSPIQSILSFALYLHIVSILSVDILSNL